MTSPQLAHHICGQEVIYKLPSLYRDGAIQMIHDHLHLIFGVFLLFSDGGECWVRSIFSQNEYRDSRPNALRTPSNSILISILGSFIYYSYFTDRAMEAQRKQVTCPSSLWGAGSWVLKLGVELELLELGWTIHPSPHETSFQHPKSHVLGNPSVSGRSEMVGHPKWKSNCGPFSTLYDRNRGTQVGDLDLIFHVSRKPQVS